MLTTGTTKDTAARAVLKGRDNGYPLNPGTVKINGITVYEGWTEEGDSHFVSWVEPGQDNVEVRLDTASNPGAVVDRNALRKQGAAVATR
jgi:hypothetical protein